MLLTVSTTMPDATDLGYLLHKHPERVQAFPQPSGTAHVFYPEALPHRCTAALVLEVDPVGLARSRGGDRLALGSFVNDRPYAASSLLAIALKQVFRSALAGRCDARPELAARAIPLELHLPSLPCAEGPGLVRRLFEPLGWRVDVTAGALAPEHPEWGGSPVLDVRLTGKSRLADALNQLYVLVPVLDDGKHYWVGDAEVEKLVRSGGSWLAAHPERARIAARYLAHRHELAQSALGRLAEADDAVPEETEPAPRPNPLAAVRREAVLHAVLAGPHDAVGDLGCGEGLLLADLAAQRDVRRIIGADVAVRALQRAARRLRLPSGDLDPRVALLQSSLTYRDDRLAGLDAAVLMEVVEHLNPTRLPALEAAVFGSARPGRVIVTTPNREANAHWAGLRDGGLRHPDHRFEWTRAEFAAWADATGSAHGYAVERSGVGAEGPAGAPTQLAVFTREAGR